MKKIIGILLFGLILITACTEENGFYGQNPYLTECQKANQETITLQNAFDAEPDSDLCSRLKAALEFQIEQCGDSNNSLQNRIDNLGDCTNVVTNECQTAMDETEAAQLTYDADPSAENCNALKTTLETQIEKCGDSDGTLQDRINALGSC